MVDKVATSWVLRPIPINNPKIINKCQGSLIWDIKAKPKPNNTPDMPKTMEGPYLSVKRPPMIARIPIDRNAIAEQLESSVLDQPNSSSSSLKKIP